MLVLLLSPEDTPFEGPWTRESWHLVVDLGWAGTCVYAEWAKELSCSVYGFHTLGEEIKDVQRVREALQVGRGHLVDAEGIDWWDMMGPARYPELQEQLLLEKLKRQIPPRAEIRASRPHRLVQALGAVLGHEIGSYRNRSTSRIRTYAKDTRTLRLHQMLGIALDKWDADYGLRRFTAARKTKSSKACVLLPSSYVNVSRILSAFASMLPDRRFLLVTTRASGHLNEAPPNVEIASLASYAAIPRVRETEKEIAHLIDRWRGLAKLLLDREDWRRVMQRGCYDIFPRWLRIGLRVRDAWRRTIEREPIAGVLCGDENNPFNRLPVLLAQNRKLPAVSCSHGALDMNVLLRGVGADVYLARGEMEKDYLLRRCAVAPERLVVGAPRSFAGVEKAAESRKDQVVFFSEPYELYSGRTDLFYGEVLPQLTAVARAQGKRAVIKLHPFENLRERRKLVDRILPEEFRAVVELTNEPLTDAFLDRTWFALTVESSVAVDCALRLVPCFLCSWFELGLFGYGRQYEEFGAAKRLRSPQDIAGIPEILEAAGTPRTVPEGLVQVVAPEGLSALFRGKLDPHPVAAGG